MANRTWLLEQLHFGAVFVGSAATVAFLASVFDDATTPESRYAYATLDGMRCVVETSTATFVQSGDGAPECTPVTTPTTPVPMERSGTSE